LARCESIERKENIPALETRVPGTKFALALGLAGRQWVVGVPSPIWRGTAAIGSLDWSAISGIGHATDICPYRSASVTG
jgi:hypothetical protein